MESTSSLPGICGDRIQLQQVLINLVMIGIEAMQQRWPPARAGGPLRSGRRGMATAACSSPSTDRGIVIGNAAMGRIFAPFSPTKSGGLGMGLSI